MGGVVGAAHWFRERWACKTNVGGQNCLCSHYCKTVRDYAYATNDIPYIFEMSARKEHTTGAFLGAMGCCGRTGWWR
jgi:hypothetical protein